MAKALGGNCHAIILDGLGGLAFCTRFTPDNPGKTGSHNCSSILVSIAGPTMNAIQALLLAWDLSYGGYFNGGLLPDLPYVNEPNPLWWYFIYMSFILELLNIALNVLPVIPGTDGSHILQSFFRCCGISEVKLYPYAWGVNFLCTLVVIVYMVMMKVEFLSILWVVLLWYVFGKQEHTHWLAIQTGGPRQANEPMTL